MKKSPHRPIVGTFEVKLKGNVYDKRFALGNVRFMVELINEMFFNEVKIDIVEIVETEKL